LRESERASEREHRPALPSWERAPAVAALPSGPPLSAYGIAYRRVYACSIAYRRFYGVSTCGLFKQTRFSPLCGRTSRKVDVRLPGKGNSNPHGARPVHLIITMIQWIRTSRLSISGRTCCPIVGTCACGRGTSIIIGTSIIVGSTECACCIACSRCWVLSFER